MKNPFLIKKMMKVCGKKIFSVVSANSFYVNFELDFDYIVELKYDMPYIIFGFK